MSLDWNLIWKMLQVVALLIIAREIDKRIRKRKKIGILVLGLLWCNITKYLILNKERRYARNKDIP